MRISADTRQLYSKKYGLTDADFSNPKLRFVLHAKIETDRAFGKAKAELEELKALTGPTTADPDPAPIDKNAPWPPPLPSRAAKRGEAYPVELTEFYRRRFNLTPTEMAITRLAMVVKTKIDADIFIVQLQKKVAALETKVCGLLAFVERYAHLKPPAKAAKTI